jgi:hypothetical protein
LFRGFKTTQAWSKFGEKGHGKNKSVDKNGIKMWKRSGLEKKAKK